MPKGDQRPPGLRTHKHFIEPKRKFVPSPSSDAPNGPRPRQLKPEEAIRGPKSGAVRDWLQKT